MPNVIKLFITAAAMVCCGLTADLFPLRAGNAWTYRDASTGHTLEITAGVPVMMNDRVYYPLTGYVNRRVLARVDESYGLVFVDEDTGRETTVTSFTPFESGWWEAPLRDCDQQAQTLEKRGVHDSAAGPLNSVLEIRFRSFSCADAGVQAEQFAENIGMVRREVNSIAGPRRYDLIRARIGRLMVDTGPFGRFTLTAENDAASGAIRATLRVQVASADPLKLVFPTAQEYELVLYASDDRVLWEYSEGQMFAQMVHERSINGEWSATVLIPRPPTPASVGFSEA